MVALLQALACSQYAATEWFQWAETRSSLYALRNVQDVPNRQYLLPPHMRLYFSECLENFAASLHWWLQYTSKVLGKSLDTLIDAAKLVVLIKQSYVLDNECTGELNARETTDRFLRFTSSADFTPFHHFRLASKFSLNFYIRDTWLKEIKSRPIWSTLDDDVGVECDTDASLIEEMGVWVWGGLAKILDTSLVETYDIELPIREELFVIRKIKNHLDNNASFFWPRLYRYYVEDVYSQSRCNRCSVMDFLICARNSVSAKLKVFKAAEPYIKDGDKFIKTFLLQYIGTPMFVSFSFILWSAFPDDWKKNLQHYLLQLKYRFNLLTDAKFLVLLNLIDKNCDAAFKKAFFKIKSIQRFFVHANIKLMKLVGDILYDDFQTLYAIVLFLCEYRKIEECLEVCRGNKTTLKNIFNIAIAKKELSLYAIFSLSCNQLITICNIIKKVYDSSDDNDNDNSNIVRKAILDVREVKQILYKTQQYSNVVRLLNVFLDNDEDRLSFVHCIRPSSPLASINEVVVVNDDGKGEHIGVYIDWIATFDTQLAKQYKREDIDITKILQGIDNNDVTSTLTETKLHFLQWYFA